MRLRRFLVLAILSAASLVEARAQSKACRVEGMPNATLAPVADVVEYRADSGNQFARFRIDFRSQSWVDGVSSCGDGSSAYPKDGTTFRVERVGGYVVYSAHCGGRAAAWDARAQVVFAEGGREPVYIRASVKGARWGLPNGIHSGPIKTEFDAVTCVAAGFDASKIPSLALFDKIDDHLKTGSRPSVRSGDLYDRLPR